LEIQRFVFAALTGLLFTACSAATAETNLEFVRGRVGGLCPTADGGGALCQLKIAVRDDGTWQATGTERPAPAEGAVAEGAASKLAAALEQGWEALTARPFTGVCPSAYDMQEVWYSVRRLPSGPGAELADADVREVRSCTYDLDHPDARLARLRSTVVRANSSKVEESKRDTAVPTLFRL
jgi:hypothetical protein